MASVTVTKALSSFFNVAGDTGSLAPETFGRSAKRSPSEFLAELKAFTPTEKRALAEQVCAVTSETLI